MYICIYIYIYIHVCVCIPVIYHHYHCDHYHIISCRWHCHSQLLSRIMSLTTLLGGRRRPEVGEGVGLALA